MLEKDLPKRLLLLDEDLALNPVVLHAMEIDDRLKDNNLSIKIIPKRQSESIAGDGQDNRRLVPSDVLLAELVNFYSLASEAAFKQASRTTVGRYLTGAYSGLLDAAGGNWSGSRRWSREDIELQLSKDQANLVLTANGLKSSDHEAIVYGGKYYLSVDVGKGIVDPKFYLGRVMVLDYLLGSGEPIPTTVPPVPQHLVDAFQIGPFV